MPGLKIAFHRYELKPRATLGAHSLRGPRAGALLRIEWKDAPGYADLHPWPELGDHALEEQLSMLASNQRSPLIERALLISREDARGRASGRNLLSGLRIPESHFLVTDLGQLTEKELLSALERGFQRAKIKVGADLVAEARALKKLGSALEKSSEVLWRLDFNAVASREEVEEFLEALGGERKRVDWLEDPLPWNEDAWAGLRQKFRVSLASDREWPEGFISEDCADFRIIKPAVDDPERIPDDLPRVFTSYLDHPLGQAGAAFEAARSGTRQICGLLSQDAYELNAFSERIATPSPQFHVPEGTGLGFDDLLQALRWEEIP